MFKEGDYLTYNDDAVDDTFNAYKFRIVWKLLESPPKGGLTSALLLRVVSNVCDLPLPRPIKVNVSEERMMKLTEAQALIIELGGSL